MDALRIYDVREEVGEIRSILSKYIPDSTMMFLNVSLLLKAFITDKNPAVGALNDPSFMDLRDSYKITSSMYDEIWDICTDVNSKIYSKAYENDHELIGIEVRGESSLIVRSQPKPEASHSEVDLLLDSIEEAIDDGGWVSEKQLNLLRSMR